MARRRKSIGDIIEQSGRLRDEIRRRSGGLFSKRDDERLTRVASASARYVRNINNYADEKRRPDGKLQSWYNKKVSRSIYMGVKNAQGNKG